MLKIAIFKTVRITTMGFVIEDTKKKFPNSEISVITPSQDFIIYKLFNVNTFKVNVEPFKIEKTEKNILSKLKNKKFDYAIIPTEGNFYTYNNVLTFAEYFIKKTDILFYLYPNNFYNCLNLKKNNFLLKVNKIISFLLAMPILFIMLFVLLIKSLFDKNLIK